jgi:hypothetical protein
MAQERIPNDPYRSPDDSYRSPDDSHLSNLSGDDLRRQPRFDNELQPDPELAEGPAGGAKVAMFAIAIAVVLGAVFYGLNNSSMHPGETSSAAQNTTQTSPPAAPPGMRDVTPRRPNTDQGVTTGAAPERPQTPPAMAPAEINRSGNPPANNAPSK